MDTPKSFLTQFTKEIVAHADRRPELVEEWSKKLGEVFYERFKKNLPPEKNYTHEQRQAIIDAARKAAGLA